MKNNGYVLGLVLGRRGVNCVSQWWLWDLLLDDLLELVLTGGHDLRRLVLYMHAMMMMQQFSI